MKTKKYIIYKLSIKIIIPIWILISICAWFVLGGNKYFTTEHDIPFLVSSIVGSLFAGAIGFVIIYALIDNKIEKHNKLLEDEYYDLFQKTVFEANAKGNDVHDEVRKMTNTFANKYALSVESFTKLSEKALKRNVK
jgi:hypothetical protein